jgi:hypothetical protein
MAIGVAADLRRLTRARVCVLAAILTCCVTAGAQTNCGTATTLPCVSSMMIYPIPTDTNMNQIYKILFYKGNVLAIDAGDGVLYQLPPGSSTWNAISGAYIQTGFVVQGMAIDAQGTLYIANGSIISNAPTALFYRVPATCTTPSNQACTSANWNSPGNSYTWNGSYSSAWGGNIIDPSTSIALTGESGEGSQDVQFENNPALDGSGTLYFVDNKSRIMSVPVDNQGNADLKTVTPTVIVNALNQGGNAHMAIDAYGNIYFVHGHAISAVCPQTIPPGGTCPVNEIRPAGTVGIYFIPAGQNTSNNPNLVGSNGQVENNLNTLGWRIDYQQATLDSTGDSVVYAGVVLDAAGDLYMTSETNSSYDEITAGTWEIRNGCPGQQLTGANVQSCLNWNNISMLAPIPGNQPASIDPRGYLWITPYQTYTPGGSGTQSDVYALAALAPGMMNLNVPTGAPSHTGTAGTAGIEYLTFNATYQPTGFAFTSASGSASGFSLSTANPLPPGSGTTPAVPCNAQPKGAYQTLSSEGSCYLWPQLDPNVPGAASGKLTMFGPEPYTFYVNGTGLGASVAMLDSPTLDTLAASNALSTPEQVASDPIGDTWVADPGNKQVLYFQAGSSSAMPKSVGSGLSAPTGVAVNGAGDIYIGDYDASSGIGTVYEIPWVPNSTSTAGGSYIPGNQIDLSTATIVNPSLGNNLNLAADGSGDVFVADPQNSRVVEILNSERASLVPNPHISGDTTATSTLTVGTGFTAPSAVAVDAAGDVFVADGTNLYEISAFPANVQTTITDSLPGTATSLAIDASGSVIAAITGQGLYRIPYIVPTSSGSSGAFSLSSASLIDTSFTLPSTSNSSSPSYCGGPAACIDTTNVTSPFGVALDQQGNIYVSDMTGGTPNLYEFDVTEGFVNYGVGLSPGVADEQDLDLFNIGNEPLTLTPEQSNWNPITGPDAGLYSLTTPSGTPACDYTNSTKVPVGTSCTLGPTIEPTSMVLTPLLYSGDTLTVPTNASNLEVSANAPGTGAATANLQAASIYGTETTTTTATYNPVQTTYPGSGTVTVTVAPTPTNPTYTYVGPNYLPLGTVQLTLNCTSTPSGSACTLPPIVETESQSPTNNSCNTSTQVCTYAFSNLPSLQGGTYSVTADYEGYIPNLMGKSTNASQPPLPAFTVSTAMPVITLSEPSGITANATNGVYYVPTGSDTTLTVNVSSTVGGAPSGTVTFLNKNLNGMQQPLMCPGITASAPQVPCTATYSSNQNWTFSLSGLAAGAYNLTAVYSGDQNFAAGDSATVTAFQDISPSVLITANPASVTTTAGTPVTTTLTIQSLVGYAAPSGDNVTCLVNSSFPSDSECTFSNPQPAICAPGPGVTCTPATTVFTLATNIPVNIGSSTSSVQRAQPFSSPFDLAGIFGLGLLGLALRRRAILNRYLLNLICLMLFLAGTMMGVTSCTNSSYTKTPPTPHYVTPSGPYTITIQVSSPTTGVVESLPFTLPVTINGAQ